MGEEEREGGQEEGEEREGGEGGLWEGGSDHGQPLDWTGALLYTWSVDI